MAEVPDLRRLPRAAEGRQDIDYDGASGSVDLSKVGEPTTGVYDVWEYGADGDELEHRGRRADQHHENS